MDSLSNKYASGLGKTSPESLKNGYKVPAGWQPFSRITPAADIDLCITDSGKRKNYKNVNVLDLFHPKQSG